MPPNLPVPPAVAFRRSAFANSPNTTPVVRLTSSDGKIARTLSAIIIAVVLSCLLTGCISHRIAISYVDLHYPPPIMGDQAVIPASINGVSGHFVIDTGAMAPALTTTAVQRCGLKAIPGQGFAVDAWGGKVKMMQATNVTVKLAPDFVIHWPSVLVLPKDISKPPGTNDNFFGIIDYHTLQEGQAVMDMKHKTITLTQNPPRPLAAP
jgi:hypothetical protein